MLESVQKLVNRAEQIRYNFWQAFRSGMRYPGHFYFKQKQGDYIKKKWPFAASCPYMEQMREEPEQNYKTPFLESKHNIRDRYLDLRDEYIGTISNKPELDDRSPILVDKMLSCDFPSMDDLHCYPLGERMDVLEGDIKEIYDDMCTFTAERQENMFHNDISIENVYKPSLMRVWRHGATGTEDDRIMNQIQLELEDRLYQEIERKKYEGEQKLYKGTPRKWQVLDERRFGQENAAMVQSAIMAPHPEQLESWEEAGREGVKLPITNRTVAAWRDKRYPEDSADFDPNEIEDRKQQEINYFIS